MMDEIKEQIYTKTKQNTAHPLLLVRGIWKTWHRTISPTRPKFAGFVYTGIFKVDIYMTLFYITNKNDQN